MATESLSTEAPPARAPATPRLPGWAPQVLAQVAYHARVVLRSARGLLSALLLPVLMLYALHATFALIPNGGYLVAGSIVYGTVSVSYLSHTSWLVTVRERGILKRLRGTPMRPWTFLAGRFAITVALAVLSATVATVAALWLTHLRFAPVRLPLLLLAVVAGALAWTSLGTVMSGLIKDPSTAWAVLTVTFLPVLFVSGIFIPIADEPHWLAVTASYLPAYPFSRLVQGAFTGTLGAYPRDLLVLGLWAVGCALAARRLFSWLPLT